MHALRAGRGAHCPSVFVCVAHLSLEMTALFIYFGRRPPPCPAFSPPPSALLTEGEASNLPHSDGGPSRNGSVRRAHHGFRQTNDWSNCNDSFAPRERHHGGVQASASAAARMGHWRPPHHFANVHGAARLLPNLRGGGVRQDRQRCPFCRGAGAGKPRHYTRPPQEPAAAGQRVRVVRGAQIDA